MKQSWLIVTDIMACPEKASRWDLIKTVFASGSKADKFAKQYQDELNQGRTLEDCVKQNINFLHVTAIPWSQAREYISSEIRQAIENAPEYMEKKG